MTIAATHMPAVSPLVESHAGQSVATEHGSTVARPPARTETEQKALGSVLNARDGNMRALLGSLPPSLKRQRSNSTGAADAPDMARLASHLPEFGAARSEALALRKKEHLPVTYQPQMKLHEGTDKNAEPFKIVMLTHRKASDMQQRMFLKAAIGRSARAVPNPAAAATEGKGFPRTVTLDTIVVTGELSKTEVAALADKYSLALLETNLHQHKDKGQFSFNFGQFAFTDTKFAFFDGTQDKRLDEGVEKLNKNLNMNAGRYTHSSLRTMFTGNYWSGIMEEDEAKKAAATAENIVPESPVEEPATVESLTAPSDIQLLRRRHSTISAGF